MIRLLFNCILTCLIVAHCLPAWASAEDIDNIVAKTVRSNYEPLHECYRKTLAIDRNRGGNLFITVIIGGHDEVTNAVVSRDELHAGNAVACILNWIRGWSFPGIIAAGLEPGVELIIPLTFKPNPNQFVVKKEDVPEGKLLSHSIVQLLLTQMNVGAIGASLAFLKINGEVPLPGKADVQQAIYVLDGNGWLKREGDAVSSKGSATTGTKKDADSRTPLTSGTALWIPADSRFIVSGTLTLLQLFSPAGLEQEYLREQGPILGAKEQWPAVINKKKAKTLKIAPGAIKVTPLLYSKSIMNKHLYMGIIQAQPGSSMPAHYHTSDELIYILKGKGQVTLGKETMDFEEGCALYLPKEKDQNGKQHNLKVLETTTAIQIYVPAGPEERFFNSKKKIP